MIYQLVLCCKKDSHEFPCKRPHFMIFLESRKIRFIDIIQGKHYDKVDGPNLKIMIGKGDTQMAVMDEFKEEREALKNGTPKQKLQYFWDYYKWHVIGTVAAVAILISFIYQIVTRKDVMFYAAMVNVVPLETAEEFNAGYLEFTGTDTSEFEAMFDNTMTINDNSMDEGTMSSVQKLAVYTAAGDLDVLITNADTFASYANNDQFHDLRDIFTPDQFDEYADLIYYVDWDMVELRDEMSSKLEDTSVLEYPDPFAPDQMNRPVPVGIRIDGCEKFTSAYYVSGMEKGEPSILGIYGNAGHLEDTLKFIEYIFQ